VPRLWSETIETHRNAVRDATLDAAAEVVSRRGLASATMSEIAETAGIGRATLYKYFPDVESIVVAWHDRQVMEHLADLERARDGADPNRRLEVVLETYALHQRDRAASTLAPFVHPTSASGHRPDHADHGTRTTHTAHAHLTTLVTELIQKRALAGGIRDDVPPKELANFCLHALAGAESLTSAAAIRRLCRVVLDGLTDPSKSDHHP
jgi:AcrR family transcriptional regulator